ncbi:hypothetical protein Ahy_B10g101506 [Arachis hypogaea]|uniref:SLC26A/SulP transporter domain-containing protein n=1 Tax=Arachis hypogaea TaxID=3818 RepID=A0A444WZS4_ARAHY|nr:hypothetical protein Ahy_B10g101506 [Arachis hypogaea]
MLFYLCKEDSGFVPLLVYGLFGSSRQLAIGLVALVSLLCSNVLSSIANPSSKLYTAGNTIGSYAKQNKTMATMKEKPHYNKTHYCRCQTKAMATVYRDMTQEKKDIVEEMGFGALAHVPKMNVSHALLRELIDHFDEEKGCLKTLQGRIYITPRKVAAALGITNGGNHFDDKVDYNNLNPEDKECAGYERRRGGELEKIQEDFCCLHPKVLLASHNGVENKRKGRKQSVDGCIFVLMLIYFHETKFLHPFAPDAPPAPWVAHWTKQMMLERISKEATEPLKKDFPNLNLNLNPTNDHRQREQDKRREEEIEKTRTKKRKQPPKVVKKQTKKRKPVPTDSESTSKSEGQNPLALSLPSSLQEELINDDFICVPPESQTQQTSDKDSSTQQQQQQQQQQPEFSPLELQHQPSKEAIVQQLEVEVDVNVSPVEQE